MSRDAHPEFQPSSIAIIGADALLAALPATPVQLAHACLALGYEMAFPASWGDELVAEGCMERLAQRGGEPAILCACPHVTERLTRAGTELTPWMIALVAPPVAAARYLRAVYGERPVHITYMGACPAGADAAIDAHISPEELLGTFEERGIALAAQPELFDSILPPDRRRFHSLPGGAPSAERLADAGLQGALVELDGNQALLALAQRLLSRQPGLIDLAPRFGCACSGALTEGPAGSGRAALTALEPPRATGAVLDSTLRVEVELPLPADPAAGELVPREPANERAPCAPPEAPDSARELATRENPCRKQSAAAPTRAPSSAPRLRRQDGRVIPRAYAAHGKRARSAQPPRDATHPAARLSGGDGRNPRSARLRAHPPPRKPAYTPRPLGSPRVGDAPPPVPPPPTGARRGPLLGLGVIEG